MVEQSSGLDRAFKALADPTRRSIIAALAQADQSVSRLAEPHEMSLAAVSKHVGILAGAGLIHRTKLGREQVCSLDRDR
ncbi:MAG: metalloregulator ArsR/SmtB family transcription factor, partial [Henriciella sp.]|uniref:ArsR/SmtB family transcription factor n=1 Tax=Henriciella sp. TaxID=1968823 RepID=UPI003C73BDD9